MNAPSTPIRHRFSIQIGVGVGVAIAIAIFRGSIAVAPGEPGWMRWLRVLADHPIRAGLAASLLLFAFSRSSADVEEPKRPPSS